LWRVVVVVVDEAVVDAAVGGAGDKGDVGKVQAGELFDYKVAAPAWGVGAFAFGEGGEVRDALVGHSKENWECEGGRYRLLFWMVSSLLDERYLENVLLSGKCGVRGSLEKVPCIHDARRIDFKVISPVRTQKETPSYSTLVCFPLIALSPCRILPSRSKISSAHTYLVMT
jgi:hypothetical protein